MGGTAGNLARGRGAAAAFAALALAAVEGTRGVVSSFDPRWEATLAITAGVFALTQLVRRLIARDGEAQEASARGDRLTGAIRAWPVACIGDTDPELLGLYPARRDAPDRYVERSTDAGLRAAVSDSRLVVLVGPRGAGKTRTAIEAVREAVPEDALLVVPRDAAALREILAIDPQLRHIDAERPDQQRVLWLDGLRRHLKALDASTLDRLASDATATIVATVRDSTWKRLLASDEAEGEAAKALLRRATVLELPLALDAGERQRASAAFPSRDFSRGFGRALGRAGDEDDPPPPSAPASADRRLSIGGPVDARRDRGLVLPLLGVVLAAGAIGGLVATGSFQAEDPPTIAKQATDARARGAEGPRKVIAGERADFRGTGENSYFFAFGDDGAAPGRERADEIQVWDQDGDELKQAFSFEPGGQGVFQFRFVGDIDGDGADELIGGYGDHAIRGELLLPFALDWDEDAESYRLVSLAPDPAALETAGAGDDVEGLRRAYASRISFTDVEDAGRRLAGYRSQDFAVTPDPHRLIGAYVSDIAADGKTRVVELRPSTFGQVGGQPRVRPCRLSTGRPLRARVPEARARPLHLATLERWQRASGRKSCTVEL